MCGIVGLFIKNKDLYPKLGAFLSQMLVALSDRGPDSAGVGVFDTAQPSIVKITVQAEQTSEVVKSIDDFLKSKIGKDSSVTRIDNHAVLRIPDNELDRVLVYLEKNYLNVKVTSIGKSIEIFKATGSPKEFISNFQIENICGTHGIGHTRMATESAVTISGAHPFSTGLDQCLVHNGSLSNHNNIRRKLLREGITTETQNDSEVAAAYISNQLSHNKNIDTALENGLKELDGFYNFIVGTLNGFAVLRDPIACKPAVMAETANYVAFGSEFRALVQLPDIDSAVIWEPDPGKVYSWSH